MPVTRNVFQAFRCRSARQEIKSQAHNEIAADSKAGKASTLGRSNKRQRSTEVKEEATSRPRIKHQYGIRTDLSTLPEVPSGNCTLAQAHIKEEVSSYEAETVQVTCPEIADSLATGPSTAEAAQAAFVLSAASLRARGRQKIPLENAKGLPERLGDVPLRLIIGGNNPSDHAWSTGHYYSHPANWMWRILKKTGIAPAWVKGAEDDERMVKEAGVGFLDVGCGHPGTILSEFSSETFQSWAPAFYARLKAHMERASKNAGCVCGKCGAPAVVGFAGKRQWMELLNVGRKGRDKYTKLDHGVQHMRPQGWPFSPSTEVWVLPSTSGAAPMATAERVGPWQELSDRVKLIEWPRKLSCACKPTESLV